MRRKSNDERFYEKIEIDEETGCWLWTGHTGRDGYGTFWTGERTPPKDGKRGNTISELAHRWSFIRFIGSIDPGHYVLHKCDTPPCVNPTHLFQGTQRTNIKDCTDKGRHTYRKSVLSDEQVKEIRTRYTGQYGEIRILAKEYGVVPHILSRILNNEPKFYGKHL